MPALHPQGEVALGLSGVCREVEGEECVRYVDNRILEGIRIS